MIERIEQQTANINAALEWVHTNKLSDYPQRFLTLVSERRQLRILQQASANNPAIAAYGVSQVGKSYLMNCLLQKDGQPFLLETKDRSYKFIEEMNPKTDNTEATGVVTRFSSFNRHPEWYSADHPILMKCLSLKDIILVVSDGYYNDLSDNPIPSTDEVRECMGKWESKYAGAPVQPSAVLTADDILDMQEYFERHLNSAQVFYKHTSFFGSLALLIDRVPLQDYDALFSLLWCNNGRMTALYSRLKDTLQQLGFSQYVYLDAEALYHNGINANTIVSVECLDQLFMPVPSNCTDVYLRQGNSYTQIPALSKSTLCAVCAEIVVRIGKQYLEQTNRYCFTGMGGNHHGLTQEPVTMDILRNNDLLDFPGARSRKKLNQATLSEDSILVEVLLRSKVAYLFNSYSENLLINILLYCHHGAQNDVADIPGLIRNWLLTYVGASMSERKKKLERTGGISPFFYVATKFNMDMKYQLEEIANKENALKGRWQQRFEKVLYHQCFNADGSLDAEGQKIFLNWTRPGENFSNSYLLRDYKFSGPSESGLYKGEPSPDATSLMDSNYYALLRSTFCQSEHVRRFFPDPAKAWDVAATVNNDGVLYIVENLSRVAHLMDQAREAEFVERTERAARKVYAAMSGYYVNTDPDQLLKASIRKAKTVGRELDFACNTDNYYFGHLLQALQMTEAACYRIVHHILKSPEINGVVNDYRNYELIRHTCTEHGHPIEEAATEGDRWQCLIHTYGFDGEDDARDYLLRHNVDCNKLFTFSYKRKLNSFVIADGLFDEWEEGIRGVDFFNTFTASNGFDRSVMSDLVESIVVNAESTAVALRDKMADTIAPIVNTTNLGTVNESLLADLLASIINQYVLDFGYSYLSDEQRDKARQNCEAAHLPAFRYIDGEDQLVSSNEALLTDMFNRMSTQAQAITPSFEKNYYRWMGYMQVAFLFNVDLPVGYNAEANDALGKLLAHIDPTKPAPTVA